MTLPVFFDTAYESCCACPKNCGVNRNHGCAGYCGETADLRIAWAGLHFGEEPPISGTGGSGTIFVSGCNLRCVFCQNYQIAHDGMGKAVTADEFVDLCFLLEKKGAENINIVTGSHAIPFLAAALTKAKQRGLEIPIVWNSSGYESLDALEMLKHCVDGWLPDLKTLNAAVAESLFSAPDYPSAAQAAITWMINHAPLHIEYTDCYPQGKLYSGVIIRHLALPSRMQDTRTVLAWFASNARNKALLSLMTQYTPVHASPRTNTITAFENRLLSHNEDTRLKTLLNQLDIETGFYQEFCPDDSWLPDFSRVKTFSSDLAKPLWHWTTHGNV